MVSVVISYALGHWGWILTLSQYSLLSVRIFVDCTSKAPYWFCVQPASLQTGTKHEKKTIMFMLPSLECIDPCLHFLYDLMIWCTGTIVQYLYLYVWHSYVTLSATCVWRIVICVIVLFFCCWGNQHFNYEVQSISLHKTSCIYMHFWKWVISDSGSLTINKGMQLGVACCWAGWSACFSLIYHKFLVG